jgi:cytochrome c553
MLKLIATTAMALLIAGGAHAAGDAANGQTLSAACGGCHGADGNSPTAMFPKLAGQHAKYLEKQLQDFKSGKRPGPTMAGMAATLDDQGMMDVSAWYASQTKTIGEADASLAAKGQTLYRGGNPKTGVPACASCHGATGDGVGSAGFPSLAGQHADYTVGELERFKSGERSNDHASMMRDIAARMSKAEMDAVANYMQGMH